MPALKTNIFVKVAVVVVVVFFVFTIINLRAQLNELEKQKELLQVQVEDLNDSIEEINLRLSAPLTLDTIEKVAREMYDYRDSDEIIFYNDIAD